jgi:hypothetical protein
MDIPKNVEFHEKKHILNRRGLARLFTKLQVDLCQFRGNAWIRKSTPRAVRNGRDRMA